MKDRIAELYAAHQQIRDARPIPEVVAAIREPGMRLAQVVATVMESYADRPAVGQRAVELTTDAAGRRSLRLLPEFHTISYGELWTRVGAVAAAWHHDAEHPVRAGDFVALLGFTSSDYTTVDLACVHLGAVTVPLQASAPLTQLAAITTETTPKTLAVSAETLDTAVELALAGPAPDRVVVFDYHPEDDGQRAAFESASRRLADTAVVLEPLASVLERGRTLAPAPLFVPDADDDPLSLLIYTSGSTGTPKGAMYSDSLVTAVWLSQPVVAAINLNYMPMSHIAGRISLQGVLARGGTAYFAAKSDMSTLFDDIALTGPTELFFVPRVCDMIFARYQSEMDRRLAPGVDHAVLDEEVKAELREHFLGGRYMSVIVGSAPIAAEMKTFIESVIRLDLHDGYGSTEAGGGVVIDTIVRRPPVVEYKLIDVPELGYFGTDKPHSRGELLLKTTTMIPGYYKRPDINAEIFDADGFYRTGDIVAELGRDTEGRDRLVYLDRRNNVLKLSQGEFVTVAKVEAALATSPALEQIFVYGSSERAYLLAVIVPTQEVLASADPKAALSNSLHQVAKAAGLNSHEIPRDFIIETEPFTTANGLLTGIGKLLRPKLIAHYGDRLQQLYAELAQAEVDELVALRHEAADLPVLEAVYRAVKALLSCDPSELTPDAHFTDLGGDSLSALSFSNLLRDVFDIDVPVGVIVSPANGLRELADYAAAQQNSGSLRPTFASVHSEQRALADDLTLAKFIDAQTLDTAGNLPATTRQQTVLLTGANGYLGRFLCLEWLERLDRTGGTLVCIVRGRDGHAARKRLEETFDSGDPELLDHFRDLAARTLKVLAGDIGEANLGLDGATWNRLAATVDLIVHPAALVNHVLPYDQLFGPNVVGTAEIIRLAITTRIKPVTYLSTVAVVAQIAPSAFEEDGDIREMSPERAVDASYANGYGNSKWAGEVLLREAHDLCGLPVAVFRSDMILAHSRFDGQLNVPDMFTRLLLSVIATGIAPFSFYRTDSGGQRQRAHYDGLPADFVAEAITALGADATAGFRTFDVLNPHDDGISLDEFVDWLIESGHPIQRIDDYADWLARFDTALRSLPETQRQASVLPLLHAYRRPAPAIRGSAIPAKGFRAAVDASNIGSENGIPHLTPALIEKYVSDLKLRDLL